jgi:hypothetical protein
MNGRLQAPAIAAALFATLVEHRVDVNVATLEMPTGERFYLSLNRWGKAGRLVVAPDWPRALSGEYFRPYNFAHEISLAETKTPTQIAAEIRRRFLTTEFCTHYAVMLQQRARSDDHAAAVERATAALVAAGASRSAHSEKPYVSGGEVSIKYVSPTTVTLEVTVSVEEACAIIRRALGGATATGGEDASEA